MSNGRWEFDENGNVHYIDREGGQPQGEWRSDGSYHYAYRQTGPAGRTPQRKKNDNGWHWVLIILLFVTGWMTPLAVILLVLELLGKWPGNRELSRGVEKVRQALTQSNAQPQTAARSAQSAQSRSANPGNYGQTTAQVQERLTREKAQRQENAQTARQEAQQQKWNRRAEKARQKAERRAQRDEGEAYGLGHMRLFRWIGGVMAGLFGFAFVTELVEDLTYNLGLGYTLRETVPLLALALIGVTLILAAAGRKRKLKKFQKYLTMVGDQDSVPIAPLAGAMGVGERAAEKDLEEMLERGFWEDGYVDAARQLLVLGGHLQVEPEPVIDQEAVSEEDGNAATLRHIRQVNDAIADPEMSEKIFRIEELTSKIFQLLEERPEKAKELRSFMSYYLPETLKILENYSKLEAQGIEGDNITEAKGKIEGMMDKLVEGYENQLDKLFADDVLDISADLKVMEQMLEKDGLAIENEPEF